MSRVLALLAAALLGGCGTITEYLGGTDNTEPPAELVDFEPQVQVQERWSRDVGAGASEYYVKLVPVVHGTRVFAADRKGEVRALDAATGETLWEADTDLPLAGGPGVGVGLVVAGSSDGDVVALAEESGEILWKARVSSEVLAAPAAAEGVVIVRTIDGKVFGLSAVDGSRLWIYDRTVPVLTLRGTSSPVLARGLAICGFDSGRLTALALDNGQPVWEARVAVPSGRSELERLVDIDAEPLVSEGVVYTVTYQGRIAALELASGNVLWRRDMSSHAGVGADEEHVYVTDSLSHVWALDRRNSASVWRQTKLQARGLTSPVAFGDYVVVGDFEGYVHFLRRSDGQFAARIRVDKKGILAAPVAAGSTLYVYGRGGTLAALTAP